MKMERGKDKRGFLCQKRFNLSRSSRGQEKETREVFKNREAGPQAWLRLWPLFSYPRHGLQKKGCLSPSWTILVLVGPGHPPQVRSGDLTTRKGISVSGSVLPRLKVTSGSISTPRNHQSNLKHFDPTHNSFSTFHDNSIKTHTNYNATVGEVTIFLLHRASVPFAVVRPQHSIERWIYRVYDSLPNTNILKCFPRIDYGLGLLNFYPWLRIINSQCLGKVQGSWWSQVKHHRSEGVSESILDYPVALDILIQSAEILVMAEQPKMASEHIEMAISLSERSYHPQFNVIKGNCRLDYRRAENRSYFIALFKHQHFVGQQGCYRTAMEICKLILSLDPEGDPLAIILVLDYYALLSKQLEYLVTFYRELNSSRNLFLLPNFSFSFPLALFKLGTENSLEDYLDESSQLLQEAIIRFPSMVLPMLEKCGGRIDPRFSEHSYLKASQKKSPICLTYLIDLYIARCHYLWKDSAVQLWLEECIHRALDMVDSNEGLSKDSIKNRFVGVSPNILRHLILSNVKDSIPEELHQGPIYAFDPLPPTDAITTYQVNPRQVIHQGVNLFQQFLRPFMPQNNNNNNQHQENEAAAAAAPPAVPAAVRAAPEAANAEEEPAERRGLIDPHRFQQSFEAMLDSILNILNRPDPD
ncbi:TCF25 [Cordylochernes scorpioides]|uniref:TCF25 n=1 Tax=Cordylochernes scorpioides TaxID=51811 RepID=A0ABY6KXW0_9ARAC|nr:TCF25 [Cordylochernes scorpioides]